jgi:hypothetical protein
MSSTGDNAQQRAAVTPSSAPAAEGRTAERLEWQSELDSTMSDIDSKLLHPRRRASDVAAQPTLPQLGQFDVTNELLDEIAWRVAEQMRRSQGSAPIASGAQPEAVKPAPQTVPHGTAIVVRLRKPLFSWKFWRRRSRRRQSMITLSDYRVT